MLTAHHGCGCWIERSFSNIDEEIVWVCAANGSAFCAAVFSHATVHVLYSGVNLLLY